MDSHEDSKRVWVCVCSSDHAVRREDSGFSGVVSELRHSESQKLGQPEASGTIPVSKETHARTHTHAHVCTHEFTVV